MFVQPIANMFEISFYFFAIPQKLHTLYLKRRVQECNNDFINNLINHCTFYFVLQTGEIICGNREQVSDTVRRLEVTKNNNYKDNNDNYSSVHTSGW